MFKLRTGYLISGIITGAILLFSFIASLPDGKLHIYFCDVGQGDGAYLRLADGRDMVVDGGPNDKIVQCLGRYMPFWDRHIDMVVMTHPQKDHMQGLISVLSRYQVEYLVRSDIANTTQGYSDLVSIIRQKNIHVKYVTAGDKITFGSTSLSVIWPTREQVDKAGSARETLASLTHEKDILGAATDGELNDYSVVFRLRYGRFDAIFTGDADTRVEAGYVGTRLADDTVEVLKVPHHGSRTGMTSAFLDWLKPQLAVISVGKNSYGHPSNQAIQMLQSVNARILRTDREGDIEVISDGIHWLVN